ncbi:MAG: SRPBCC family protein [Planctomycetes bacterium]|nr:SRPBCC family protein [Planctomycetota bacterium]
MTHTYQLQRRQLVRRPLAEVFDFFSDAANLAALTPDSLHFKILTPGPIELSAGTRIEYRLRLFGVPFFWCTEIETFEPMRRFTDVQAKGPYRRWHHTHEFREVAEGTEVIDRVEYEMPLGWLGRIAHRLFVRRNLRHIFDFRRQAIERLLPSNETKTSVNRPSHPTSPGREAGVS